MMITKFISHFILSSSYIHNKQYITHTHTLIYTHTHLLTCTLLKLWHHWKMFILLSKKTFSFKFFHSNNNNKNNKTQNLKHQQKCSLKTKVRDKLPPKRHFTLNITHTKKKCWTHTQQITTTTTITKRLKRSSFFPFLHTVTTSHFAFYSNKKRIQRRQRRRVTKEEIKKKKLYTFCNVILKSSFYSISTHILTILYF